ncbi:MAG: helix-turn-helix transcriptional regulator [Gammaproteobacteria bacterium]|nr:helix-turn-helix transcriptional regulator [Gammaproteobacteria bacterium]
MRQGRQLSTLIDQEKFTLHLYHDLLSRPEQAFSRALGCLQQELGAAGGLAQLRNVRSGEMIPLAINDYPEHARKAYTEHFGSIDPWQARFVRNQISTGVNFSDDVIRRDTFEATELYQDYWKQLDFGDAIGVFGRVGGSHAYTFGLPRLRLHGKYTARHKQMLEPVRAHLHNAVALTLELEQQKRKAQIHNPLTEQLPVAIFLVDQSLRLLDHNSLAAALLDDATMFSEQQGCLSYHHAGVQEQLLHKLKAYASINTSAEGLQPEAIPGCNGGRSLPAHNIYLLPSFDGYLLCFQIVVTVADAAVADAKTAELLARLFGLTEAEGQVAACLFNGSKPVEIAAARGVSVATVRAQLKSIMAKAQCHSQLELVRRISQLLIPFR